MPWRCGPERPQNASKITFVENRTMPRGSGAACDSPHRRFLRHFRALWCIFRAQKAPNGPNTERPTGHMPCTPDGPVRPCSHSSHSSHSDLRVKTVRINETLLYVVVVCSMFCVTVLYCYWQSCVTFYLPLLLASSYL